MVMYRDMQYMFLIVHGDEWELALGGYLLGLYVRWNRTGGMIRKGRIGNSRGKFV